MAPTATMQRVLRFLGFPFTASFQHTINRLTLVLDNDSNENNYATEKDSKKKAFKWRRIMDFRQVREIQDNCSDVIQQMGLKMFASEQEYKDS